MKTPYLPLLILAFIMPAVAGPIEQVAELIRKGDVSQLSKMFASTVEITMQNDENVYSKAQASVILDRFFSQNKPLSVKTLHKVNSNPSYLFAVIILNTQNGPYRIAYTLKDGGGRVTLIELRIEKEKVK